MPQSIGPAHLYRGSVSANEGINQQTGRQIKETVDPTQKGDQENSHDGGKWKPRHDGCTTGTEDRSSDRLRHSKRQSPTGMRK